MHKQRRSLACSGGFSRTKPFMRQTKQFQLLTGLSGGQKRNQDSGHDGARAGTVRRKRLPHHNITSSEAQPVHKNAQSARNSRRPGAVPERSHRGARTPACRVESVSTRRFCALWQLASAGVRALHLPVGECEVIFAKKTRKASSLDVELGKKRYRELLERRK